ncbi:hypothetical protein Bbelb_025420 [Branchiostoma belcheri]|nr:hypothetical protein Bbelb_025420 [Branchiostoma belcheri]
MMRRARRWTRSTTRLCYLLHPARRTYPYSSTGRTSARKASTAVTEGEESHGDFVEKMSTAVTEGEHRDCVRKTSAAGTEREHRDCGRKTSTSGTGEHRDCVRKTSTSATGGHRDCGRKTSTAGTEGEECNRDCVRKTSTAVTEGENKEANTHVMEEYIKDESRRNKVHELETHVSPTTCTSDAMTRNMEAKHAVNSDISEDEVERALQMTEESAPSPTEGIPAKLLKKGGEGMVRALHYLLQRAWRYVIHPTSFKQDPKVLMPKPNKENYNNTKSYRPITLQSIISKLLQRIISNRLVWLLEAKEKLADTQDAYRKQRTCTQTVLRMVQDIQEAWQSGESVVLVVMDLESCYERIWRESLILKLYNVGVNRRLLVNIQEFKTD